MTEPTEAMRKAVGRLLGDTKHPCDATRPSEVIEFGAECMAHAAALIVAHVNELNTNACMDCLCLTIAEDAIEDGDWLKGDDDDGR